MTILPGKELKELSGAIRTYNKITRSKNFDICDPKQAKKEIIKILQRTGDKIAAEDEIEQFLSQMMESCQIGSAKGALVTGQECKTVKGSKSSKTGKRMTGWVCYNKVCAKATGRRYMDCVTDKKRTESEYYPKKDFWKTQAENGCPGAD